MNTATEVSVDVNIVGDGGEIISSVSIEHVVNLRQASIARIQAIFDAIKSANEITSLLGAGTADSWGLDRCGRWDVHLVNEKDGLSKIIKAIDKGIWKDLMDKSGMLYLMDAKAKDEWNKNLSNGSFPEVSAKNIYATFEGLHAVRGETFERGVINAFKQMSWDYKTNCPCKFGEKIILDYLVTFGMFGFELPYDGRKEVFVDLERMMTILDSKPAPDHRINIGSKLHDHLYVDRNVARVYEDDYFHIRYYKKGTAHIKFKRVDLVEKLNAILVKHYPAALPSRV